MKRKIRVLVVDDDSLVRRMIARGLSENDDMEIIGEAENPYEARDKIVELEPDVMTLDVEMPRMSGLEFLRRLMPQYPLATVMLSSHTQEGKRTTLDAMEAGAVDFVSKPRGDQDDIHDMFRELAEKIRVAFQANLDEKLRARKARAQQLKKAAPPPRSSVAAPAKSRVKIIALGASTGGTTAIREIVTQLPPWIPGMLIVQHMPAGFTRIFSERLNELSSVEVREAKDGDEIRPGLVLVAPGDFHMRLVRENGKFLARLSASEKVCGHRPSVDVLFESVASLLSKEEAMGVLLTGMGRDGAQGLLKMRERGARTIGQNETTCVVYGMPRVARELGAVEAELPLNNIPDKMVRLLQEEKS